MANAALRERQTVAAEQHRKGLAEALQLRDRERDRAAGEAALRSDLEAELRHLRAQLEESRAGWEEARTNLGVVAAACREADAKSRELQEHRRVLAREVRRCYRGARQLCRGFWFPRRLLLLVLVLLVLWPLFCVVERHLGFAVCCTTTPREGDQALFPSSTGMSR